MLTWLRNLGTKRRPTSLGARAVRFIRAKFDSAQTTPDSRIIDALAKNGWKRPEPAEPVEVY